MKKYYKKIIVAVIAAFLVFSTIVTINVINLNKERTKEFNSKKLFPVKILFVDKKNTPKDVTLDDVFRNHFDSILYVMNQNIPLDKKEGNYYVIDLHDFVNEKIVNEISGEVFAKYNLNGEVVNDIKYDAKNKIIKVPTSYYEDSDKYQMVVQGEFIDVISATELQNIEVPIQITNNVTKHKTVKLNAKDNRVRFSILKYKNNKKLTKDDIDIYVNNRKDKLPTKGFDYNSTTGVITLNYSPIYVNNIDVQFNKKNLITRLASRIVNLFSAEAVINTDSKYKLASAPTNVSVGTQFRVQMRTYYYTLSDGITTNPYFADSSGTPWTYPSTDSGTSHISWDTAASYIFTDSSSIANLSSVIYHAIDIPTKLTSGNSEINFGTSRRLKLACVHISNKAYSLNSKEDGDYIDYTVKVITYDSSNRELTLAFLSDGLNDQSAFGSQSAWGVYSFYWEEDNGYISITKNLVGGEGDTSSRTFKVYTPGTNNHCGGTGYESKGSCTVTTSSPTCTVGKDSNGKGTLPNGKYCIWEDGDGENGTLDKNYVTSYSGQERGDDNYNYGTVTLSKNSSKDSNNVKYTTASVTNVRRKWCFAARKTDIEGGGVIKGSFTFTTNAGGSPLDPLSTSNAIARFGPYVRSKIYNSSDEIIATVSETASSTMVDTDINKKFWQIKNTKKVVPGSIIEATYNSSNQTWSCPAQSSFTSFTNVPNVRVYYCAKINKKDSSNNLLKGAQFTFTGGGKTYKSVDINGRHSIFLEDNPISYSVEETTVPKGYAKVDNFTFPTDKIIVLPMYVPSTRNNAEPEALTKAKAKELCESDNTVNSSYASVKDSPSYVIEKTDYKLLLNWYKVTENQTTKADGAKFKVYKCPSDAECNSSTGGTLLKFTSRVAYKDSANDTRNCYNLDDEGTISELESATIATGHKGEVCITGLEKGYYTVEETHPAKYHTFGTDNYKKFTITNSSTAFKAMDNSNKYVNLKTTFKFKKNITNTDSSQIGDTKYTITRNGETKTMSLSEMTIEQLKLITFRVYPENSTTPLNLIKTSDGVYEYDQNPDVDKSSTTTKTTDLHLTGTAISNLTITIEHLPLGKYSIKEVDSSVCQIGTSAGYGNVTNPTTRPSTLPNCNNSVGNSGSCIGYYTPNYSQASSHQFEIKECSNDDAGTDKCTTHVHESQALTNKPTEITLTKKDFYHYDDAADVQDKNRDKDSKESTAEFENDKERSDFDRIDFKVKDPSGNYLNLIYVGKHGNCKTDDSYSIYRYVPGLQLPSGVSPDVFNSTIGGTTQTLHACGGHIKVINLCRGNKYTFEEIKVPDDSVYVKEGTPQVCFTIPCSEDEDTTQTSETHIINDKGTRVRFEKRDSKYNYLIPDETTTFQVYRCPKVNGVFTDCHPSDYASVDPNTGKYIINQSQATAAGLKLVRFSPRKAITGDEEDAEDAAGLAGVEVYNMMSDSDVDSGKTNVVDLHPYHGILVLRYLQSGYHYVLIETVAPKNYTLPKGQDAETAFTVRNDTVNVREVDVPNVPTSLLIKKYDDNGKLLKGAQFKVYEGTTCDPNLSAMNQPKNLLKLKTIRDGVYEARPPYDDSDYTVVQTCDDENGVCNNIPTNEQTRLTYERDIFNENINNTYVDSYADFENMVNEEGDNIEIKEGEALIQYLEYNHCYIIEEIKAPEGHSLPKHAEDRFTMVTIKENEKYFLDTGKALVNKPTPFTFYKFDEYNQLLDGAEFKLQKLDDNKKYNDITVTEIEEKGMLFYKVDGNTDNKTIRTRNGSATVYYLTPGQYRILETSPAPGKELSKNPNIATFFVDEAGNVYGNSIIVNKNTTGKRENINESSAEFIIGIQTGQTVIRYGIIIGVLVALITGLMILRKKSK